jgi:hypothetical protein
MGSGARDIGAYGRSPFADGVDLIAGAIFAWAPSVAACAS